MPITLRISENSVRDFTGIVTTCLRHNQGVQYPTADLLAYSFPTSDNGDILLRATGVTAANFPSTLGPLTGATLGLYQESADAGTRTIDVLSCLRTWVATEAYAFEWAAGQGWTTELARGSGTDYDPTALGSVAVNPATVGYISFTLNSAALALIESWRSGSANNGFVIARTSAIFNSGDSTTNTFASESNTNGLRPFLDLTFAGATTEGSRKRKSNVHPGKRGPVSQLSHFRRGFRPNTQNATANVTVALTGVAGAAAVGTVAQSRTVPMTGNVGASAVGTAAPVTSVAVTGSAATSAVGSLSAQSGAAVGSRRRAMGTSPRVTPFNLRKFYKTARNSVTVASPDVTLALTGVAATSAAGSALTTRTVPLTGNAGAAAVGTLVPANAQPVTGNAATSAVGTLAAASAVALTGNAATGAVGSVSSSGTGTASLTGISAPASAGTVAPASSVSVSGVAGTGAAGNTGVSRTVALTGNAASGLVGNVAAGNDIIVAISGVAATSAVGSVKAAVSRVLAGSAAAASAGSVAPSGTGVFETGNELVWRVPQRSRVWHLGS